MIRLFPEGLTSIAPGCKHQYIFPMETAAGDHISNLNTGFIGNLNVSSAGAIVH
jgi:hypothetical protein